MLCGQKLIVRLVIGRAINQRGGVRIQYSRALVGKTARKISNARDLEIAVRHISVAKKHLRNIHGVPSNFWSLVQKEVKSYGRPVIIRAVSTKELDRLWRRTRTHTRTKTSPSRKNVPKRKQVRKSK